jgi:hypothetical protein
MKEWAREENLIEENRLYHCSLMNITAGNGTREDQSNVVVVEMEAIEDFGMGSGIRRIVYPLVHGLTQVEGSHFGFQ